MCDLIDIACLTDSVRSPDICALGRHMCDPIDILCLTDILRSPDNVR